MNIFNKFIVASFLYFLMILIEGCSSSVLVDVWSDPSFNEAPLKNILVIAVRKNPIKRRIWEDAFVSELSKCGVMATSSYHFFPDALPDTNQVIQTIEEKGFDGILLSTILLPGTESRFVEGTVTEESVSRYNEFQKRYDVYYQVVEHPGYIDSVIVDRRLIDVWITRSKRRLIWSATSNSPENTAVEDVQNVVADLVVDELKSDAIIKSAK
jgi:hypothetical protein